MLKKTIFAAVASLALTSAFAQTAPQKEFKDTPKASFIKLTAQASREVPNDLLVVRLFSEKDASSRETAYKEAVKDTSEAVAKLKDFNPKHTNFTIYPVYTQGVKAPQKIAGYRYRYSLSIESKQFDKALAVVGAVADKLAVESMNFTVSKDLKRSVEKELMAETIVDLKDKGNLLAKSLGNQKMDIAEVDFTNSLLAVPMMESRVMGMKASAAPMMADAGGAPLVAESGNTRIDVSATAILVTPLSKSN